MRAEATLWTGSFLFCVNELMKCRYNVFTAVLTPYVCSGL
jgi:hypothetical protein